MISKKTSVIGFVALLFCEINIPSFKLNLVLQSLFLLYLYFAGNTRVTSGFLKTLQPVLLIFLLGFFGIFFYGNHITDMIKDISHFIKPIVGVLIGYLVFFKNRDATEFFKSIILVGGVTATVHLGGVVFFSNFPGASISELRADFGFDSFIEIFAFYILIFANNVLPEPMFKKKMYSRMLLVVLFLSIVLYFSRTMMVIVFLVGISMMGYAKITGKGLKIIGVFVVLLMLFYAYLFSIKLDRGAKGVEGFFYKVKIAPAEIFETKVDRSNHAELWDHWRGYEATRAFALIEQEPGSAILGQGFGSLVNLKFRAPLGENGMRYISTLHNGYMYVFYKTGIVGLLLLLLFLGNLYQRIYRPTANPTHALVLKLISTIGLYYLFTTLIITGIYIPKDTIILVLGGALALERGGAVKKEAVAWKN